MREYKREKATIESQLNEMEKRSRYHDDHLRTIDIWFDQVGAHLLPRLDSVLTPSLVGRRDKNLERRNIAGAATRW